MTVVGLHPEELFDKLFEGEITPAERERLQVHLEACAVCRFEYEARLDFRNEAGALRVGHLPPLSPLPMVRSLAPRASIRRRRSRVLVWGLSAAALISASAAVASVVTSEAPWRTMSRLLGSTKAPAPRPAKGARPVLLNPRPAARVEVEPAPVAVAQLPSNVTNAQQGTAAALPQRAPARGSKRTEIRAAAIPHAAPELSVARSLPEEASSAEPTSAAKLFAEANQARRSGDFGRAAGLYRVLQEQFSASAEAELSRVTLSLLLLDNGDAQGALNGFERYLAGGARGLEAEALVGRARALGRLGRRDLEATAWQEVRRKYPRSIYGKQASERLSALGRP